MDGFDWTADKGPEAAEGTSLTTRTQTDFSLPPPPGGQEEAIAFSCGKPARAPVISEGLILHPRLKTDVMTPQHGIATGPVNHATFQFTGPRVGILKLEDCTVS